MGIPEGVLFLEKLEAERLGGERGYSGSKLSVFHWPGKDVT